MLRIHIDKRVVGSIENWNSPDLNVESQPRLVRDLFSFDGVVQIFISPYEITIEKGGVFEWKEMTSAILHCIQTNLEPEGELVETKPPSKKKPDLSACEQYEDAFGDDQ